MEIREMIEKIAKAIGDKKGEDLKILDLTGVTDIADYFVIATGNNTVHVRSLCDLVEEKIEETSIKPIRKQGYDEAQWVVLDYGDVVVHLFRDETRKYYELEKFWRNAMEVQL